MVSGLDSNPSHLVSRPIPIYFMLQKLGQALASWPLGEYMNAHFTLQNVPFMGKGGADRVYSVK